MDSYRKIAAFQINGGIAAFIDLARTFDPAEATAAGVNLETLLLAQPETAAGAKVVRNALTRAGVCGLIVQDHVDTMVATIELDHGPDLTWTWWATCNGRKAGPSMGHATRYEAVFEAQAWVNKVASAE